MSEFVSVCRAADIPLGTLRQCELPDGTPVCVGNVAGTLRAIGGECTHSGGPLGEGELDGLCVVCPWHGGSFDLETGEAHNPPASDPVPIFDVRVVGDDVQVRAG